jgi:LSU ribosomal protein L22P
MAYVALLEGAGSRKTAKAALRDVSMSYKATVETLRLIRGRRLEDAKRILEEVVRMERPVPFRRFNRKVAHKKGIPGAGRYPVKVAKNLLRLLENLENNAEFKGLDVSRLWIVHAAAHKGPRIRGYMPRAFGRATPWDDQLVHVEVIAEERGE